MSPLGGGWLTGKYQRDRIPTGSSRLGEDPNRGVEAYELRNNEHTFRILDVLAAVAERHHRPMAHVAIAWLSSRPGVASVLLGARTIDQLNDNLAARDLELDDQSLHELTAVSAIELPPYPYRFLESWSQLDVWQQLGSESPSHQAHPEGTH